MGHDTHFLGRLDRVSDAHVERALTLYRDEALLKEVLNRADLPEGVERLAISLDDPREGPFVIVTREGRFVTCLGKGMRLSKDSTNTVLTRERLDAAAAKVERMREHLAQVERLMQSGAEGVGARAFRRMANDGLRFCREDAETLLGALPLFASEICVALTRTVTAIQAHQREVARLRFDKLNSREEQLALDFGRWAWAAAHLIAFVDHDDVQALFLKINEAPEVILDMTVLMSFNAFDLGTLTHATRALWLIGRRPRLVLADVKSLSLDGRVQLRVLRELALGVVAQSSAKHRAEARKALSRPPVTDPRGKTREEALASYCGIVGNMVRAVLDDPARRDAVAVAEGRLAMARLVTKRAEVSDEERAAIPEPVARAAVASRPLSWLAAEGGASRIDQLCGTLPWIARAEAADLFLPREYAQLLPVKPLDDVQQMIEPYAQMNFLTRPKPVVRSGEKVGRNDPCPCGSGKKRKHCCGMASG